MPVILYLLPPSLYFFSITFPVSAAVHFRLNAVVPKKALEYIFRQGEALVCGEPGSARLAATASMVTRRFLYPDFIQAAQKMKKQL